MTHKDSAESVVRQIRRKTRRKYSAEEKIRIVLSCVRQVLQFHFHDIWCSASRQLPAGWVAMRLVPSISASGAP